jgi:hypothetical protein
MIANVRSQGTGKGARFAAYAVALVVVALSADACVIADPPTDLPQLPETRPTILRGSVVPSASAVLGRWPDKFVVPVELHDPRVTFWYAAFIDFPGRGDGIDGAPTPSQYEPGSGSTRGRVRMLEIPISKPSSDRCHVIEVVVALQLSAVTDPRNAHTPGEPGGDIVTWFYNPTGDLSGCPILDAGIKPEPVDAEVEGGPE